jgi:signal transduction histidine kinase
MSYYIYSGLAILVLVIIWLVLRAKARLNALEYEFINIVTHTFRTPTTVIKWSIDDLRKSPHLEEIRDGVNQIESSNERIIELLDTLINFNSSIKESDYTFAAMSFREMAEEVLRKYGPKIKEKEITLTVEIDPNIPLITADSKRLQFVVEVLMQNAIMYTPVKGQIYVGAYAAKRYIQLIVKDSGMGVKRKDRRNMFYKFFRSHEATTTNTQGVGIGLYVARKIIDLHRGRIWVKSDGENKGSTFYIKLPIK